MTDDTARLGAPGFTRVIHFAFYARPRFSSSSSSSSSTASAVIHRRSQYHTTL